MPRTKGAKDKKPRKMTNAFQPQLKPGIASIQVRLHGPVADMRWFEGIGPELRGNIVAQMRRQIEG